MTVNFAHAIVRTPSKSMIDGISTANLGKPDYGLALEQHAAYVDALRSVGLNVIQLPADEGFPDGCFVEDTALVTQRCAIIARPGAASRRGEEVAVQEVLEKYFDNVMAIQHPGTLEPGDIMMVGDHFYIGLSKRTNEAGARQMISWLQQFGYQGSTIRLKEILHLKTGVSYLENNTLVASGEFLENPSFEGFNLIEVENGEAYAANCIWVNGTVIVPVGFRGTEQRVVEAGYPVIAVPMSEFQKLDGGLSCLSLRF